MSNFTPYTPAPFFLDHNTGADLGRCGATVADLRRGDLAALFSDCSALQRIRYATPHQSWGVRVEWDNGPGSRVWVRFMPKGNPVQIADRTAGN